MLSIAVDIRPQLGSGLMICIIWPEKFNKLITKLLMFYKPAFLDYELHTF